MKTMAKALFLLLVLAAAATAKEAKIGIIVSSRILEEYPEAQDAQRTLSDEIQEWQRQAQEKQDELQSLSDELNQQAMMFYSEEKKAEKQDEFQRKLAEYRDFQNQIETRAMQRNQELFQPINDKIQKVIDKIAAEEGFDLILDAVGTNIAYADPSLDITDLVLEELKKQ
ncbi:MAG TPA: OmpH family outer membrane protein [Bacteroidetes bacterium]|nr:OmpH family outer membrane protein [Bacteroidota bacterium]